MREINPVYYIITSIFGEPTKKNHSHSQYGFDCPVCSYDVKGLNHLDGKGNLEINLEKYQYNCWSCGQTNGTHGSLIKLIKVHGSKSQLKQYKSLVDYNCSTDSDKTYNKKIRLPKEFISFKDGDERTLSYKEAFNYISERGHNIETLEKYNIGYCDTGKYENRIIIPSYDNKGELNYFTARTYVGNKLKYLNPVLPKMDLIVNGSNICWDSTIFVCEGMLDAISLYPLLNVIPLLGKELPDYLYYILLKQVKGHICLILDPDAQKNMYQIYKRLQTSHLKGRIRVVDLPGNADLSDIKRDFGQQGIAEILKTNRQLSIKDFMKYNI